MATYTFTVSDFNLTTTWKRMVQSAGIVGYDIISDSVEKNFAISGINLADNESIKRVMLTATINRSGTTDYSEVITVNSLGFSNGSRKIDSDEIANGTNWTAKFYVCATGNVGAAGALNQSVSHSCTIYFSDVTLTITTGTGSSFDGFISSLSEGTKIMIDESGDTQGQYTLVNHDYNTGKALLWRDDAYTTSSFNSSSVKFIDGILDNYLNVTFYENLPDTTKAYIISANYPTLTNYTEYGGTVENLERYVCTPSTRELFDGAGSAEGTLLIHLETVPSASATSYWTRSMVNDMSVTNARYVNAEGNDYFGADISKSHGVRPCFCVSEEQLVVPSDDGTYYTLTSSVASPATVYLNGVAADMNDQQREASAMLSWDAVENKLVTGYEVWSCDTADGEFAFFGAVTVADDGSIPTEMSVRTGNKGFMSTFFKVKAVTTPDTDYLDSALSDDTRLMNTKRTNVHYYDGVRWLLASIKHYNGNAWGEIEGAKYYDGTQWVAPSS